MTMGGAATGLATDINGALQWNPAAISGFNENILSVNAGLFFSSPELSSTAPSPLGGTVSGITEDDRGTSVLPSIGFVYGTEESQHTFGVSAFGISGFGVTFPESMTNPINAPQSSGGFGRVESNYQLLQVALTYAYQINDNISIGFAPTIGFAGLELEPNPIAAPSPTLGYPVSDNANAIGFGGQIGLHFTGDGGFSAGVSYKSNQAFSEFDFDSKYLDGSAAPDVSFQMDYPAIISAGLGYSTDVIDVALDYRMIDYENTEGFEASGWQIADSGPFAGFPTGAVEGFGWENVSVVSLGVQYKGVENLPLRLGYTYSSNPINEDLAFFSVPATAIIAHAFQFGFGYNVNEMITINTGVHYGMSDGETTGMLLNPLMISPSNPLGQVPSSEVSYDMTTSMVMLGVDFNLSK
ncbi:MAG: outer membrane protein transport protein, partial [Bacteroidia bacterium]|nr:outer membrane protein transport protein [Bacteroidia bacterium]